MTKIKTILLFKKIFSFILITSFLIPLPYPVYAQDISDTEIYSDNTIDKSNSDPLPDLTSTDNLVDEENTTFIQEEGGIFLDTEDSSTESTDLNIGEEIEKDLKTVKDDGQNIQLLSSTDPQDIPTFDKQLPSQVDYSLGSLNYKFPIKVPPGRNNLQPTINLKYNNQNTEDTVFGYAWDLDIPYIVRENKKGSDQLYQNEFYYSSLSGELSTSSMATSTFVSKVDNGEFLKYKFENNSWVVFDKRGNKYSFGLAVSERQNDPSNSNNVYKWMLSEIRDLNNNYIKYQYYKDDGQIYPSSIIYTGHDSTDGIFEVIFNRTSRADNNLLQGRTGFLVSNNYKINQIEIKINGTWVKKYDISYGVGDNSNRSIISSITESGQDEQSNVLTLPSYEFTYSLATKGWTDTYGWSLPTYFDYNTSGFYIGDVNGDSLPDVIDKRQNGILSIHSWINNGDGTWNDATTTWNVPTWLDYSGTGMGDFNGDGLVDIYHSYQGGGLPSVNEIYINNGNGWSLSSSTMPLNMDPNYIGTYVIDINGDGLSDVIRNTDYGSGSTYHHSFINNGDGTWTDMGTTTWAIPQYMNYPGSGIADLNGDGLPDIYRSAQNGTVVNNVFLNNGHGFTDVSGSGGWSIPVYLDYPSSPGKVVPFVDVNGDGLVDIIYNNDYGSGMTYHNVYINNGDGTWSTETDWNVPEYLNKVGTGVADFNGDGLIDIYNSNPYTPVNKIYLNNGTRTDFLVTAKNDKGGILSFGYKASPEYKDGSGNLLNPNLPYIIHTVDSISTNDGMGNIGTTTYAYSAGFNYYSSPIDKKIAGFNLISKTDPSGNITKVYFHQGNSTDSSKGEYQDDISKLGKDYRTELFDNNSNLYSKYIKKWNSYDLGYGSTFVKLSNYISYDYNGDLSHKDKATIYIQDNSNGNLIQKIEYGEVVGNDDGSFSDIGSDIASTTITYVSTSTVNLFLPETEITQDQSYNKVKENRYYYDGLSLGSVNKGNLTKVELWKVDSSYSSTTKSYNSFGLVSSESDGLGNIKNYSFDDYNLYVSTSTNPLSQVTSYLYDYSNGKVKQKINHNGYIFKTLYDPLDRIKEYKQPDIQNPNSLVTRTQYIYTDNVFPVKVQKVDLLDGSVDTNQYLYIDGFGREIQNRIEAEGVNTYSVSDKLYNNRGNLVRESLPYFASSTDYNSATTSNALFTNYIYDALNRSVYVSNSLGTTTNIYKDWQIITLDPLGNEKSIYEDAYSNLVTVVENNSGVYATTTYSYDLNKNLKSITDALGNIRNFTYDGIGRLLTTQDLHDISDITFNTYTFNYNDANKVIQKTDSSGKIINYTYDVLNRLLTEDYIGSAGNESTYTYDNCGKSIGYVCTASSTSSFVSNLYNVLGLVEESTTTISGINYKTNYLYDRLGNNYFISYPDNSQVSYVYNSAGKVESIMRREATDIASSTVVSNIDYTPLDQISYIEYGNGAITKNTYDPYSLYRLKRKLTTVEASSPDEGLQNFSLMTEPDELQSEIVSEEGINIDGEYRTIDFTDDNLGEDLIIKTDKGNYDGITKTIVYFSIENTSKKDQNIDIQFYFPDNKTNIIDIQRVSKEKTIVPNYEQVCKLSNENFASSTVRTPEFISNEICDISENIESSEYIYEGKLTNHLLNIPYNKDRFDRKIKKANQLTKDVNGYLSSRTSQDKISGGDKNYYKASLSFEKGSSGKFFIDVVGSAGSYGHLDPWFESDWNYRKKITISGSSGSGANYQVLLKIGETSGATGENFDLGGHSLLFPSGVGNGGDLRFTSSDGETELDYWVEDVTGTSPNRLAYVWVEVAEDLNSSKDIYVYYGKSGASNVSNGNNTFILFDDFNDSSINYQKWTTICSSGCKVTSGSSSTITETGGVIKQYDAPVAGSQSRIVATSTPVDSSGYAFKRRFRRTDNGTYANTDIGFGTNVTLAAERGTTTPFVLSANYENKTFVGSTGTTTPSLYNSDITQNVWYRSEARRINATTTGGTIWSNTHSVLGSSINNLTIPYAVNDNEYPQLRAGDGHDVETDWVLLRKYRSLEPMFSSVGVEEAPATTTVIQDINYTYDANGNITKIEDFSNTELYKVVDYVYDGLNRLISASTTQASLGKNYKEEFNYDVIGNITSGPKGTYLYQGNQGVNYANPHAVTSISGLPKVEYVQSKSIVQSSSGTQTSVSFDGKNKEGNLIIVSAIWPTNATDVSISDTRGNTYTNIGGVHVGPTGWYMKLFYAKNITSGPNTITMTTNATVSERKIAIHEYGGLDKVSPIDTWNAYNAGTGTLATTTTLTATMPGELIVSFDNSLAGVISANSPYTLREVFGGSGTQDGISTSSGNVYGSFNQSYGQWGTKIVIFKPTTEIATTSYTYDWNGNLLSSNDKNYGYNYKNQLTQVVTSLSTSTYGYNTEGQRVYITVGTTTTYYPNKNYTISNGIPTKHIFLGNELISTIYSSSTQAIPYYIHTDHLGSTNVVTNASSTIAELTDYYTYGSPRISQKSGSFVEKRKYIGEDYDKETNLSYLNARYYDGQRSQFLSVDPASRDNPGRFISDPQQMNSYSYARNNPIANKDTGGEASYYFSNGAGMTGLDYWNNGTYYQSADNATLQANAARMQNASPSRSLSGLSEFIGLVKPGGAWDFKSGASAEGGRRGYYFFNGQLVDAESYGNIHYGYVGTAGGFGQNTLFNAAGLVQIVVGNSRLSWYSSRFDDPADQQNVQYGISGYNPLSSSAVSAVSNFNSSNFQTRVDAVNTFNSGSGASTPQSQLWTTPNGAIIDWSGTVVSPGIK